MMGRPGYAGYLCRSGNIAALGIGGGKRRLGNPAVNPLDQVFLVFQFPVKFMVLSPSLKK